jgi:hypothetical protein
MRRALGIAAVARANPTHTCLRRRHPQKPGHFARDQNRRRRRGRKAYEEALDTYAGWRGFAPTGGTCPGPPSYALPRLLPPVLVAVQNARLLRGGGDVKGR